ncbi:BREX-5 system adenine-specific DNA-methyltransferase PglX [Haloarcula hispanica]|uniref:site-specific DNA-methyltransferase (adenine-specific) n=1 Tax=Haloarcula hispanica TaxID=51589 RepID=A0A482TGI3_HALHI|nr:BREX-5 system adenine-specific DNA-methyltransferase PglX [Haloarcula hispanica]MCJ0618001.1 BREX-5 system adenine-specific DNA-methyltransferase PglX [Haloarcula hispanica]RYJ15526.1 BREX-5 system adenine-specific DNA-methyltransferase PglX [Haloarcula hispanica]
MDGQSTHPRKAQLDKEEREHLEAVVTEMRDRVEANVRYQLEDEYGLDEKPDTVGASSGEPAPADAREDGDASLSETQENLVEAIELEAADGHDWEAAHEQYITGVGYTIVNRLAALRCMEVRDFIDDEVTSFRDDGLTPAADRLVTEEFMLEEEAVLEAYRNECDALADEIEILFDRSTAYSLIDPDDDTYEDLCGMLDEVPDEVWRGDDVLGWVYEYYNRPVVEALDAKNTLEPEDVGPANQFYTPHWVVRMLTDNSLGKLYLEATGQESAVPEPEALSPEERKERLVTPEDSPSVPELCTYLIPDEETGDAPEFDHPSELRVIDPACGSGHFLLYAFDVLERIWWAETDLDRAEIPAKVLEHNLYGVDIDLRSCQLSAFNLYLKARTRTEEEGGQFEMPNVDIVCADARVAEVEEGAEVLDEITGEGSDLREALGEIIDTFQHTEALGSLLDVSGTLEEVFESGQTGLSDWGDGTHQSLNSFLKALREEVDERSSDSFGEQNLRSFLNLLVVLSQEYDVALMNPPYGSGGRMPDNVQEYIEGNDSYAYTTEYYINFFESGNRIVGTGGRVGMLVPRSFMFKRSFQSFREDFIGGLGSFDFLAEFGIGLLDKATVRNAGAVVRVGSEQVEGSTGEFVRLHDVDKGEKESAFLRAGFVDSVDDGIQRWYSRELSEFSLVPGTPLSYWVPKDLRSIYTADTVLDADNAGVDRDGVGVVKQGLATADDGRFLRRFWETSSNDWKPFAKGGEDAWVLPRIPLTVQWGSSGKEVKRYPKSYPRNEQFYFQAGLTYTAKKENGRRFGYLPEGSIFAHIGSAVLPDRGVWQLLSFTTSALAIYLMLCQTPERSWEVGNVAKLPCKEEMLESSELEEKAQEIAGTLIAERQTEFRSPYYTGPILLQQVGQQETLSTHDDHTHRKLINDLPVPELEDTLDLSASLQELGVAAAKQQARMANRKDERAAAIDESVFDQFEIPGESQETVLEEIALRTNEDPRKQEQYDPEAITAPSEDFPEQVKDLLLHFTLRAIHDADDGIVPLSEINGKDDLLTHIEAEFERIWGQHATDRLAEADEVLGNRSASDEAYPNLRAWLENDLFEYHVSKFDRTPILWRFSTERLVSDPAGEGFGCLVDYHQLDASIFDRLQNQYLEPRRTYLRERQTAANSRRNDESLSSSERADAVEEYERCESGLEQLSAFEEQLGELSEPNHREWPDKKQDRAAEAAERVAAFRERTVSRLETLESLADLEGVDMADLFSPSFYETVQENKDEWVDALDDLQTAFEAYAEDGSEPVEAHLYDLFEYYDDLVGSSHYASNGILFMTYYFDQFEDAGQAQIGDGGVSERQRLLSELAADVDEYTQLGEKISDDCDEIAADIPSDWADRALSEITTAGYQPNHKHGVAINITPLAEQDIVPEIVEDKVL